MTDNKTHLRIKIGNFEVECTAAPEFLQAQLSAITKGVVDLYLARPELASDLSESGGGGGNAALDLTTDTIATVLGVNSGPELVMAAAANLQFTQGKSKFSRQELIAEMRSAPNHFKETFVNNLSQYLGRLTKSDRLRLVASETYALSSKEKADLEAKLAKA